MISRRPIAIAVSLIAVLLLAAFIYDRSVDDTIADGVSVGGIDVSGLHKDAAHAKLQRDLRQPLLKPVKVSRNGRTMKLTAAGAGVNVDIDGMVDEALRRGNTGFFAVNAVRRLAGADRNVAVETRIDYSKRAVKNFIARVRKSYDKPAKDAAVKYSPDSLGEVDGQTGVSVRTSKLRREIAATFNDPDASRRIKLPVKIKKPKVTRAELADKYPTILLVDRENFRLRVYKKLKLSKTYKIAVGQAGRETPTGLYTINTKQVNPAWHVPNSDWAGKLAGKVIPPNDPENPLKARWLGIYDGVGIHGTDAINSIGSAASHGCIRMIPAQVIDLYDRVPVGTPVYIG